MLPAGSKVYVPPQIEDMQDRGYCGVVKSVNATSRRYIIIKTDDQGVVEKVDVAQFKALRMLSVRDMQYPKAAISGEVSCMYRESWSLLLKDHPMLYGSIKGCALDHRSNPMYYLVELCAIGIVTGSMWFLASDVAAGHQILLGAGQDPTNKDEATQQIMRKPMHEHAADKKERQRAVRFNFKHDDLKTKTIFMQLVTDVPWLHSRREQTKIWTKHLDELFKRGHATELRGHKHATKSFSAWAAAICKARKIWRSVEAKGVEAVKDNDAVDVVSHLRETKILGHEKHTSQ